MRRLVTSKRLNGSRSGWRSGVGSIMMLLVRSALSGRWLMPHRRVTILKIWPDNQRRNILMAIRSTVDLSITSLRSCTSERFDVDWSGRMKRKSSSNCSWFLRATSLEEDIWLGKDFGGIFVSMSMIIKLSILRHYSLVWKDFEDT